MAKIFAAHIDLHTHLGQARPHAVADAVAEGLFAGGAFDVGLRSAAGGQVGIVGGDDGRLLVVVAGVENEGDGIPDPLVGLLRAEIVEDEDFGARRRA